MFSRADLSGKEVCAVAREMLGELQKLSFRLRRCVASLRLVQHLNLCLIVLRLWNRNGVLKTWNNDSLNKDKH